MISTENYQRYQRQIFLKEFGAAGQQKLLSAKVLVIGAGGLGCPVLLYLAASGVGTIGIVDFDVVDISNLHRQILYSVDDINKSKVETAAKKIKALNPEIEIQTFNLKLNNQNALQIISDYDIVIDGSDNFSTRYLVNDACMLLNKPLVYGAVLRFEGQVGVFNLADNKSGIKTNYRDLFPHPPDAGETLSCKEAGVLGVVPGIIGTMQAIEAIKIITEIGKPLYNKIISFNILNNSYYDFEISPNEKAIAFIPKNEAEFLIYNYDWFCGVPQSSEEITVEEFEALRSEEIVSIIDVREKSELPLVSEFDFTQIPMSEFEQVISSFEKSGTIVVFCQTGKRSAKAVQILKNIFPGCKAYSLTGGIIAWESHQQIISLKKWN
jgi:adenylyltransferase/sulfurtransferase